MAGVAEFGKEWAKIVEKYEAVFSVNARTNRNLMDKWWNMETVRLNKVLIVVVLCQRHDQLTIRNLMDKWRNMETVRLNKVVVVVFRASQLSTLLHPFTPSSEPPLNLSSESLL